MKYKYWLDNTGLSNGKKNLLLEYFQTAEEVYRGTEETYQKIPQLKEEEIQRITKAKGSGILTKNIRNWQKAA